MNSSPPPPLSLNVTGRVRVTFSRVSGAARVELPESVLELDLQDKTLHGA